MTDAASGHKYGQMQHSSTPTIVNRRQVAFTTLGTLYRLMQSRFLNDDIFGAGEQKRGETIS